MDERQFDDLARMAGRGATRRGLLHLLAALPLGGALAALLDDESEAWNGAGVGGRRRRRRRNRDHDAGERKEKRQRRRRRKKGQNRGCQPESPAQTCAGRCGTVTNACGEAVDCGPCACDPACSVCQRCDEAAGQCVPDPAFVGQVCGAPGELCRANGVCACDAESCGECATCGADGRCANRPDRTPCGDCQVCVGGSCEEIVCPACQVCDAQAGECVDDPSQNGLHCDDGDLCSTNGQCQDGVCVGSPVCTTCETCNPSDGTCSLTPGYSFCVENPSFPPPTCGGTEAAPCICLGSVCSRAPDFIACTPGQACTTTAGVPGTCVDCPNPYTQFKTACAPPCP